MLIVLVTSFEYPVSMILGAVAAAADLAVLAREAFPVQSEVVLWLSIGAGLVALGAVVLRADPIAPLRRASAS